MASQLSIVDKSHLADILRCLGKKLPESSLGPFFERSGHFECGLQKAIVP